MWATTIAAARSQKLPARTAITVSSRGSAGKCSTVPVPSTKVEYWLALTECCRKTQSEIPKFPYIGGVYAVGGYNSPNCGSCWSVSYGGKTIHVLAIDSASRGLNIGLRAMNDLTNNRAVELGRVEANVQPVNPSACGL